MSSLSNCPFCDHYPFLRRQERGDEKRGYQDIYWVECHRCGAQGGSALDKIVAVELWERRIGQPKAGTSVSLGEALEWHHEFMTTLGEMIIRTEETAKNLRTLTQGIKRHFEKIVDKCVPSEE